MNSKQRRTLEAIYADPPPASLKFGDVEGLLLALGCEALPGKGSHLTFKLGSERLTVARPHPGKELKRYAVREARAFLDKIGVTPWPKH